MFINVVITRVILFVPPFLRLRRPRRLLSRGMRPVSSRFLQSSSSFERASPSRIYARENMRKKRREREKERKAFSHERARSSRPPFLPPFLSFSSFLSFLYREAPSWSPSFLMQRSVPFSFFLNLFLSRVLSAVLSLTGSLASVSLIFLLSLATDVASSFSVVLVFRALLFLFFLPLVLPRVAPFPSEFTPERVFLPLPLPSLKPLRLHHTAYPPLATLFLVLFCPCRSPVFCTLRI